MESGQDFWRLHTSTNRFLRTASADVVDWALISTGILPSFVGIMGNDTVAPLLADTVITDTTSSETPLTTLLVSSELLLMFFQSGDALSVT